LGRLGDEHDGNCKPTGADPTGCEHCGKTWGRNCQATRLFSFERVVIYIFKGWELLAILEEALFKNEVISPARLLSKIREMELHTASDSVSWVREDRDAR